MLNIDFQVLGFETVFFDQMGNAIPEVSQGPAFTQRQRDQFKRLARAASGFTSPASAPRVPTASRECSRRWKSLSINEFKSLEFKV